VHPDDRLTVAADADRHGSRKAKSDHAVESGNLEISLWQGKTRTRI
jgi:hypothetical protein